MTAMGRPESETSSNLKMVVLMLWLTRYLCITWKSFIIDISLCVLRRILEMNKGRVHEIALI